MARTLVDSLVAGAADRRLRCARWTGYGGTPDADRAGGATIRIQRELYAVREVEVAGFPIDGWAANVVAGDSGNWVVGASMDCMSSYFGWVGPAPRWPSVLEVAPTSPDAPVS